MGIKNKLFGKKKKKSGKIVEKKLVITVKSKKVAKNFGAMLYGKIVNKMCKEFEDKVMDGDISVEQRDWNGKNMVISLYMKGDETEIDEWLDRSIATKVTEKLYSPVMSFDVHDIKP